MSYALNNSHLSQFSTGTRPSLFPIYLAFPFSDAIFTHSRLITEENEDLASTKITHTSLDSRAPLPYIDT